MPEPKTRDDFPCPCGRMTVADCAGECAQAGACVVCNRRSMGTLNGVGICGRHWHEVAERITGPSHHFLKQAIAGLTNAE